MRTGVIGNMVELGITESYKVKLQVLLSAAEAAEMILRVDNIIKAAPRYNTCYTVGLTKRCAGEPAVITLRPR